jgi:hypothetical protein
MNISAGWFLLAGGVVGAIGNATAKRFFKSDFQNLDGVISEEDRRAVVPVTKIQRLLLVVICVLLAIVGVVLIQLASALYVGLSALGFFI